MKKAAALVSILLILAGCTDENNRQQEDQEVTTATVENEESLAAKLNTPWQINHLDGDFYLSERTGTITKVENGESIRQSVELQRPLSSAAEAGLLGFVLAPDFNETNEAYAYYTYEEDGQPFNAIVVLELQNDQWSETKVLIDGIPSGSFHHGGRLAFGPDEKLYATTGDASNPELAQDLNSLAGKILRVNLDGSIPDDNPFKDSYVYSYGHRNPQGLTWAEDGTMYASEHGPSANDEINRITAGSNYGWPEITGNESKDGMESPIFTSGDNQTWAPSGMAYYENQLFVAGLRGEALLRFDLETGENDEQISNLGRIRDVYIINGQLYFISNNTDGRGTPGENDDQLYSVPL